jgi:hypothetical protein
MEKQMPTAVESPRTSHGTSTDHIKHFEKKVQAMRSAFAGLPNADSTEKLLKYIHQPGWTTPAETIFFETMVDTMTTQAQQMAQLHKQLMAGASVVGRA